jgi:hypothetical protein
LDSTALGLRFKLNSNGLFRPDQKLLYVFGTSNTKKKKYLSFVEDNFFEKKLLTTPSIPLGFQDTLLSTQYLQSPAKNSLTVVVLELTNLLRSQLTPLFIPLTYYFDFKNILFFPKFLALNLITSAGNTLPNNLYHSFSDNNPLIFMVNDGSRKSTHQNFRSDTASGLINDYSSFIESSVSLRFTRFYNPLINYDYKCGHYLMIWDQLYPNLITSFIEVSRGIRKSS